MQYKISYYSVFKAFFLPKLRQAPASKLNAGAIYIMSVIGPKRNKSRNFPRQGRGSTQIFNHKLSLQESQLMSY